MLCYKCRKELPEDAVFCPYCGRKQDTVKPVRKRLRGNGQGSVYKFRNGWRVEIVLGYDGYIDEAGIMRHKRRVYTKSGFEKKQDAIDFLAQYKASGQSAADRHTYDITLKALYDEWLPTHKASRSTIDCYKAAFKVFAPVWELPMREQDIDDLQECLDDSGKGRRTQENARAALGLVYKYGTPRGCIPNDRNLASFLRIDAEGLKRTQGFTEIELARLWRAANAGDHVARLIVCACYTGFRPSAFLGELKYDREHNALIGGIKTDAGKGRTVTIAPKIQGFVDAFAGLSLSGCLFCRVDGTAYEIDDYRDEFYACLERVGIDNPTDEDGRHRLTPHSCRHTFATLLKRVQGADKDKLELMGHTSGEMLRHYQDVAYEDLKKITDAL